jgi:hypothetical protein
VTPIGDEMPRRVGALPERVQRNRGPNEVTLKRAREIRSGAPDWYEWPKSTLAGQLRKTLASCQEVLRGGGAFEVESRNGKTYARFVPPALGSGPPATTPAPAPASAPRRHVVDPRTPTARVGSGTLKVGPVDHGPDGVTTVVDDDGEVSHTDGLPPFRPLGIRAPERDLADAPVSKDAWRPKVKCPTCREYLVIEEKSDGDKTLKAHYADSPTCKTAQKSA